MFDKQLFQRDPRSFAIELVEEGLVSSDTMISLLLGYMSHDDVREALDANELSPRFEEDSEIEEIELTLPEEVQS